MFLNTFTKKISETLFCDEEITTGNTLTRKGKAVKMTTSMHDALEVRLFTTIMMFIHST